MSKSEQALLEAVLGTDDPSGSLDKAVKRRDYLRRWLVKNYAQATLAEVQGHRDAFDAVTADVVNYERRLKRQAVKP